MLSILELISAALSIWASKEKTKYQALYIEYREAYFAEMARPEAERSDAVLDSLRFKISTLADSVAMQIKAGA